MQIIFNILLLAWICDLSMKYEKVLNVMSDVDKGIKKINITLDKEISNEKEEH